MSPEVSSDGATAAASAPLRAPRSPWWRRALLLLGFGSAVFVLSQLNLREMMGSLERVSLSTILVACGCMWLNMGIKSVRWHRMLAHRGVALPFSFSTLVFFEAMAWGSLTLARAGELFRAQPLVDRGVPLRIAMASILLDRALDVGFLIVAGFAALALVSDQLVIAALIGAATVVVLVVVGALGRRRTIDSEMPQSKVKLVLEETRAFFYPLALLETGFWTVLSWVASMGVVYALAVAVTPAARVASLVAASFISSLSTLLPITYQGIGTREPIFAAMLARDGVANEAAVLLALLNFTAMFVAVMALGVGAAAIRRRMHRA